VVGRWTLRDALPVFIHGNSPPFAETALRRQLLLSNLDSHSPRDERRPRSIAGQKAAEQISVMTGNYSEGIYEA
jgi:hypothetical protein